MIKLCRKLPTRWDLRGWLGRGGVFLQRYIYLAYKRMNKQKRKYVAGEKINTQIITRNKRNDTQKQIVHRLCWSYLLQNHYYKYAFRKFNSLPLGRMLTDVFHTKCWAIIRHCIVYGFFCFSDFDKNTWRVWPVGRGC